MNCRLPRMCLAAVSFILKRTLQVQRGARYPKTLSPSTALRPSPIEGKGDRLRWMRCQPGRRTLLISLSIAQKSGLTANLNLALRAARVNIRCPSEACVRAGKSVEGFRSTRNPSTSPHKAAGIRPTGGVGLRPAGLCDREHSPAVRHCGNASLAGVRAYRAEHLKSRPFRAR